MYKVLIADDEKIIRMGLCSIIDWNSLGFEIIGEAANGAEALSFMIEKNPDVVMIDIKMPKLHGLDAIKEARKQGYTGKIIVLSGYSDFSYAQTAIKYGVVSYLTKPVDTDDLEKCLNETKAALDEERSSIIERTETMNIARDSIIRDFVTGSIEGSSLNNLNLNLDYDMYQVVLYEAYRENQETPAYNLSDLLRVTNQNKDYYDFFEIDGRNVALIKGKHAVEKFDSIISKYTNDLPPEKNSPLDTVFITCGPVVTEVSKIPDSYNEAYDMLMHRFFCDHHQHVMTMYNIPKKNENEKPISKEECIESYVNKLINHLQTYNRNKIASTLKELQQDLYNQPLSVEDEKNLLVDIYLQIKEKIFFLYSTAEIPFMANSDAINYILQNNYLYQIITFLSEQFEMIMNSIGYSSRDSIIDDIVHYIDHNYAENITLENIAPLFGYNSSYLGKIFSKKMNVNFNTYLDNIRIEHSKELLLTSKIQVYKVAELVGYRNVDYFHIKFKKNTGISPAEFRRVNKGSDD